MSRSASRPRGVTLIELMVVVAIIAIVTAIAVTSMARSRPRATLSGATVELRALLHQARQQALVSGADVAVLVFPGVSGESGSLGRIVTYQDKGFDFFNAASTVHFGDYDPIALGAGKNASGAFTGEVLSTWDLPHDVVFGPAGGMGAGAKLPAPLASIPVTSDCTFCAGAGAARRGALVFDRLGRARFYGTDGAPLAVDGGAISITSATLGQNTRLVRMLAVTATTGSLQSVNLD